MTLMSRSRSKVTNVNGEGPGSLGSKIRETSGKKTFDLDMTLRSSSRSKVRKVNGEGSGSLGSIIRDIKAFYLGRGVDHFKRRPF